MIAKQIASDAQNSEGCLTATVQQYIKVPLGALTTMLVLRAGGQSVSLKSRFNHTTLIVCIGILFVSDVVRK